jgi:hypothetical protein
MLNQASLTFFVLLLLCGCGYRCTDRDANLSAMRIQVPYIAGDTSALLNNELVYQLAASGKFYPVQSGGDAIVQVEIIENTHDRIGFRYDRDNPKGRLEKNLLGVENRRFITAKVCVLDATSGRPLLEPQEVSAAVDYDYTDPGSPRDLLLRSDIPMMEFSLGQLDSREGAHDAAAKPLFQKLSQKIVMGLVGSFHEIKPE